jgi:zinc transporter ZupT
MHDGKVFEDGEGSGHSGQAVLVALCLGDFMHNFTDGVIIGAAFKLCSTSVAWGIVVGTCAHEVSSVLSHYHPLVDCFSIV